MKLLRKLLRIVVIIVILLGAIWWYLGGFTSIKVEEQQKGPYTIAYVEYKGDYSKVGPAMDKIYKTLEKEGIQTTQGIGIYYDDPATIKAEELRSEVGVIIDQADFQKLNLNSEIYKVKNIQEKNYIIATFPLKNMISYTVGVMKVYPVVTKYLEKNGYNQNVERIEIYDMSGSIIYYLAEKLPITK